MIDMGYDGHVPDVVLVVHYLSDLIYCEVYHFCEFYILIIAC